MRLQHDSQPDPTVPSETSRRSFLGTTARIASVAVPALTLGAASTASAAASLPALYPAWNRRNFREIMADEDSHVDTLVRVLGPNARPVPIFQNLAAANINQFAVLSQAFENTGVGAYRGAVGYIFNSQVLALAASIALTEAYHSGFLNTLLNDPITPGDNPFIQPLTIPQIISAVSPFIVSLNGGPPLMFDTTPSTINDLNILNFALALEYLEKAYYDLNVPHYFP